MGMLKWKLDSFYNGTNKRYLKSLERHGPSSGKGKLGFRFSKSE